MFLTAGWLLPFTKTLDTVTSQGPLWLSDSFFQWGLASHKPLTHQPSCQLLGHSVSEKNRLHIPVNYDSTLRTKGENHQRGHLPLICLNT